MDHHLGTFAWYSSMCIGVTQLNLGVMLGMVRQHKCRYAKQLKEQQKGGAK
jgi:hypothetical protein